MLTRPTVLQIQRIAYMRDEDKAREFWLEIMTFYTAEQLLVVDETAKDRQALANSMAWSFRGRTRASPTRLPPPLHGTHNR